MTNLKADAVSPAPVVRFPDDTNRISILGRTGSGKTQAGLWHLSLRRFDGRVDEKTGAPLDPGAMPWIIFDTKGEAMIRELALPELKLDAPIPTAPGLYVVRPLPVRDDDAFERMLWRIWARENVGSYFDEGYMVPERSGAFQSLLTQGRSKRLPMIILSQRPVEMSRFVWSESEYFQLFALNHSDDIATASKFIKGVPRDYALPSFYSYYFDVGTNTLTRFSPVPERDEIIAAIRAKLPPQKVRKL